MLLLLLLLCADAVWMPNANAALAMTSSGPLSCPDCPPVPAGLLTAEALHVFDAGSLVPPIRWLTPFRAIISLRDRLRQRKTESVSE